MSGKKQINLASSIQVGLTLFEYSEEETKAVQFIDTLKEDGKRIQFSLLIQVKLQNPADDKDLQLELIQYDAPLSDEDGSDGMSDDKLQQKISRLSLDSISLERSEESTEKSSLLNDPWAFRQGFLISVSNVPTKGPGDYAIVAYLKERGSKRCEHLRDVELLDCLYFSVS